MKRGPSRDPWGPGTKEGLPLSVARRERTQKTDLLLRRLNLADCDVKAISSSILPMLHGEWKGLMAAEEHV